MLAVGEKHYCYFDYGLGKMFGFGDNSKGQLGVRNQIGELTRSVPIIGDSLTDYGGKEVLDIRAGAHQTYIHIRGKGWWFTGQNGPPEWHIKRSLDTYQDWVKFRPKNKGISKILPVYDTCIVVDKKEETYLSESLQSDLRPITQILPNSSVKCHFSGNGFCLLQPRSQVLGRLGETTRVSNVIHENYDVQWKFKIKGGNFVFGTPGEKRTIMLDEDGDFRVFDFEKAKSLCFNLTSVKGKVHKLLTGENFFYVLTNHWELHVLKLPDLSSGIGAKLISKINDVDDIEVWRDHGLIRFRRHAESFDPKFKPCKVEIKPDKIFILKEEGGEISIEPVSLLRT